MLRGTQERGLKSRKNVVDETGHDRAICELVDEIDPDLFASDGYYEIVKKITVAPDPYHYRMDQFTEFEVNRLLWRMLDYNPEERRLDKEIFEIEERIRLINRHTRKNVIGRLRRTSTEIEWGSHLKTLSNTFFYGKLVDIKPYEGGYLYIFKSLVGFRLNPEHFDLNPEDFTIFRDRQTEIKIRGEDSPISLSLERLGIGGFLSGKNYTRYNVVIRSPHIDGNVVPFNFHESVKIFVDEEVPIDKSLEQETKKAENPDKSGMHEKEVDLDILRILDDLQKIKTFRVLDWVDIQNFVPLCYHSDYSDIHDNRM